MTSTTTPRRARSTRRALGTLACTLVAAWATTLASLGLGATPLSAQADPGDTFVAIGSSQLVQSEDLASIQLTLDTETVVLDHDVDFSSCLGEGNPWTAVLPGSPAPISGTWSRHGDDTHALSESIAQADTPAQATAFATTLVKKGIRTCRKPVYDFHYGPLQTSRVGDGYATWALSYTGKHRKADGGVVVIRKGTNVGFLQVQGTWGPSAQTLESVAKVATDRLLAG